MSTKAEDSGRGRRFGATPRFGAAPRARWQLIAGLGLLAAALPTIAVFCRPTSLANDAASPVEKPAIDPERLAEMRAVRRDRLMADHSELMDAANGTDFAETPGYRALLGRFLDHAPPESSAPPQYLDHALALEAPELLQGERVRVRGVLCDWWPVRLDQPVWGRHDVFRGFVAAADGTDWVAFDVLDPPENVLRARDPVEIDAVLYRTVTYEVTRAVDGKTTQTVPYVLARSLRALEAPALPTEFVKRDAWVVLTVLGLGLLWVVWRGLRVARQQRGTAGPRRSAGFHELFQRRLRRGPRLDTIAQHDDPEQGH